MFTTFKKPISVLAISISMTEASIEASFAMALNLKALAIFILLFECMPYIRYPMWFKKYYSEVLTLLDSGNKLKAITLVYIPSLSLKVWPINIRAQKIDSFTFETFRIILANFHVKNKLGRAYFFQKTFLLIAISINVILRVFFLIFSNIDIVFAN